jgi:cysteine desulfurase family protein (TIGR01976 family)
MATAYSTSAWDTEFVRAQFPAFSEPTLAGQAFFENAGGSYACGAVIDRLHEYYRRLKVQPYYPFAASAEAGEWMDAARARMAEYLGVAANEVHFGPSTSQNSYVLAQAFRTLLRPGDEIIVTNQDHEANSGVWRRLALQGVIVREWRIDADSGLLDLRQLDELLSTRTRLLTFPHASNIVGHVNPVEEISARAHAAGALTLVDGVSWAPHGLPDVRALKADVYLFSLYKTYGPHQGLMVLRGQLAEQLGNEGHYFNAHDPFKRLCPAGPDHAQVAAARGIAEYFDELDAHHHRGAEPRGRPRRVREALRAAELPLLTRLLEFLARRRDLRLLGPARAAERAATVAFVPHSIEPRTLAERLARRGYMIGYGHFYAVRVLEAMGVDAERGAARLSFVHYTSAAELDGLLEALEVALRE